MNIGIVTLPLWGNYGGLIQNYALQQILISLGHNPITFDYMPIHVPYIKKKNGILYSLVSNIIGLLRSQIFRFLPRWKNKKINNFITKNINTTSVSWNKYSKNDIKKYNLEAIIVGSDQVWRPKYNRLIEDMFLGFCHNSKIKKIAYAASFGCDEIEYSDLMINTCSKLLKKFKGVSVREDTGLELLKHFNCYDGHLVADPTILLGREGFDVLLNNYNCKSNKADYLGCYILDPDKDIEYMINKKSEELGLSEVIQINEKSKDIGPIEWISMIRNSRFVLTDSFHGMVLCILYHIPFQVVLNNTRGADRFRSLLSIVELTHCIIDKNHIEKLQSIDINWSTVDEKLKCFKNNSISFLKNNLN